MDRLWNIVEYVWKIYEIALDIYGISMECQGISWNMYGISMEHLWNMMEYNGRSSHIYAISLNPPSDYRGLSTDYCCLCMDYL